MEEKLLIVCYIGLLGHPQDEYSEDLVKDIKNKIDEYLGNNHEIICVPDFHSNTTRFECINPKYVTDVELIKEHNDKMIKLNNVINKL